MLTSRQGQLGDGIKSSWVSCQLGIFKRLTAAWPAADMRVIILRVPQSSCLQYTQEVASTFMVHLHMNGRLPVEAVFAHQSS